MIEDKSEPDLRVVSGVALRIPPHRRDTLLLEFKTDHGPFRFALTHRIALEVAEKISDGAKFLKPAPARDQNKE